MSAIAEIGAAIEKPPDPLVDELARWLETLRLRRAAGQQRVQALTFDGLRKISLSSNVKA